MIFSGKKIISDQSSTISFRKVNFFAKGSHLLKNVTVDIPFGKITSIIGPSGSGKSTLLRLLNRMYDLYPDQVATGEVLIGGANILSPKINVVELRQEVGMVFQKPTPFPMSVYDNLAFPLRQIKRLPKKQLEERIQELLINVSLWDEVKDQLDLPAIQLSGGQQQRLCIARSLSTEPKIILLDEPTSALDPKSVVKLEGLIQALAQTVTVILVTHNLNQAKKLSEKTLFLSQGEVIEFGDSAEFFSNPIHPLSRDYLHL